MEQEQKTREEAILKAIRSGDAAAFDELIGEYEKFPEDIRDFFLKDAFTMRDDALEKIRKYRREARRK